MIEVRPDFDDSTKPMLEFCQEPENALEKATDYIEQAEETIKKLLYPIIGMMATILTQMVAKGKHGLI